MGMARYMVTIRFSDSLYPNAHFFNDPYLANMFYYDWREVYKNPNEAKIQLWKLSDDGLQWNLKLSNDNA